MLVTTIALTSIVAATLIWSRSKKLLDRSTMYCNIRGSWWRPYERGYFYAPYVPLQMYQASKGFRLSPGVSVKEVDVSTIIPSKTP